MAITADTALLPSNPTAPVLIWGASLLVLFLAACVSTPYPKPASETTIDEHQNFSDKASYPLSPKAYQYFLHARQLESSGQIAEAVDALRLAIAHDSHSAYLHIQLAHQLISLNQLSAADTHLRQAIKLDPEDPLPHFMLGELAFFASNFEYASDHYLKATTLDPLSSLTASRLADVLFMTEGLPATVRFYEQRLSADPLNIHSLIMLSRLYPLAGRNIDTVEVLVRLLELDAEYARPVDRLGEWYIRSQQPEIGIELLLEIESKLPPLPIISLVLGKLHLAAAHEEEAARHFHQARAFDVWDDRNALQVGFAYLEARFAEKAAEHFRSTFESGGNRMSLYLWGHALLQAKNYEAAISVYSQLEAEDGEYHLFARVDTAQCLYLMKKRRQAEETIKHLIAEFGASSRIYMLAAEYFEKTGRANFAIKILKEGLKELGPRSEMMYNLGMRLETAGHKKQALAVIESLHEYDPYHADALNFIGYSYSQSGTNLEQAEIMIRRAISLKPTQGYIIDSLGWVRFRRGDIKQAIQWLSLAATLEPMEAEIFLHLALALKAAGEIDRMNKILEDSARLEKTPAIEEQFILHFPDFSKNGSESISPRNGKNR